MERSTYARRESKCERKVGKCPTTIPQPESADKAEPVETHMRTFSQTFIIIMSLNGQGGSFSRTVW